MAAAVDMDSVFSELIQAFEIGCREVKEVIRDQEMVAGSKAEGIKGKIENEVAALQLGLSELDKLVDIQDNISFLQVSVFISFEIPYVPFNT